MNGRGGENTPTGGDVRMRSRSSSLAPLRERGESTPSPGVSRRSPGIDRAPISGPGVDHILGQDGDNLIHTVEQLDTFINAQASVIAEGIRSPQETEKSALDGIKSLFRSAPQAQTPDYDELLSSKVLPFLKVDAVAIGTAGDRPEDTVADSVEPTEEESGDFKQPPNSDVHILRKTKNPSA